MNTTLSRIILAGILIAVTLLFFTFDLHHWLTLDNLKSHQHALAQYYDAHTVLTISFFQ